MDENKNIERLMFYLIRHYRSWDLPQASATFNYNLIAKTESDILSSSVVIVPKSSPYIIYDCVFLTISDRITKTLEGDTINYKMFSYLITILAANFK